MRGGVQSISLITPSGKLYFKIKEGSFKAPDVVEFLKEMKRKFKRKKLMIIWDGARTHTSQEVKDYLKNEANGRIYLVRLPPYSPQLNADEQVHGIIKCNDFKNRLFTEIKTLKSAVTDAFYKLSQKPKTIANFFRHKEVHFYLE